MNDELVKAEQQLTGFDHAFKGGDIISLIEAMGLRYEEWEELKYNTPWMAKELTESIDEYFASK